MSERRGLSQPGTGDYEGYRLRRLKQKAAELGIDDPNDPRVVEIVKEELEEEGSRADKMREAGVFFPYADE